jgi:hypothetical protein
VTTSPFSSASMFKTYRLGRRGPEPDQGLPRLLPTDRAGKLEDFQKSMSKYRNSKILQNVLVVDEHNYKDIRLQRDRSLTSYEARQAIKDLATSLIERLHSFARWNLSSKKNGSADNGADASHEGATQVDNSRNSSRGSRGD